ncbi:fatty acid desaturase domain-containing protein [Artemisia annua]|uniref:Fatty acid desaturase domain-containing protein n=1 Tax=Artemisia annua TaxID=35608 RepID=A0A2U1LYD7_ARTAN|nr:fatty acid desaturase domain-containing protein [Artemisia annua]
MGSGGRATGGSNSDREVVKRAPLSKAPFTLEHDENFIPKKKSGLNSFARLLNTPTGRLLRLVTLFNVGWLLYICFNASGQKYEKSANHFNPYSPIYNDSERFQILLTDIGLLVAGYGIYNLGMAQGFTWLVLVYFAPLVIVYGLLAVITWLHHTHRSLPHYDSTEWTWLRGALSTIDRDYGVLNGILNHITDTHVVHHLFLTIPHYHAVEATKAIKPILGEYYQFDDTPVIKAMWREATECFFVEADEVGFDMGFRVMVFDSGCGGGCLIMVVVAGIDRIKWGMMMVVAVVWPDLIEGYDGCGDRGTMAAKVVGCEAVVVGEGYDGGGDERKKNKGVGLWWIVMMVMGILCRCDWFILEDYH